MQDSKTSNIKKDSDSSESSKAPPPEGLGEAVWKLLEEVTDPEVTVLSVIDIGII